MENQLSILLTALSSNSTSFSEVIVFIEKHYTHQATAFKNGDLYNETTQNQGSFKVFSFAKKNNLSVADTLSLFAEHYQAVLATPNGTDHQNIRQFMLHGWEGVVFDGEALQEKHSL